jgi:hypothetical protein
MNRHLVASLFVGGSLALALPAAALADLDLVVQMPLAVVEVEEVGYPRDDLGLLVSGLVAADVAPADTIDILRWAALSWYLDEVTAGDVALRLVPDADGVWMLTDGDVVAFDLDDDLGRRLVTDRDVVVVDRDRGRRDAAGPGLGAWVQRLHARGLRGTELADAIHTELRHRGIPAGRKGRLAGPEPLSPLFVTHVLPGWAEIGGRRVELRPVAGRRFVAPAQARRQIAEARRDGGRPDHAAAGKAKDGGGPPSAAGESPGRGRGRGEARATRGGGSHQGGPDGKAGGGGEGGGQGKAKGGGQGKAKGGGGGQGRGGKKG